jgi:nicotinamide riboside kinase
MILFIEGPRHSGKTYLINKFLESCSDPRVEYYKFYFANHVKTLGITDKDSSEAFHYFSLGNIMTILEMNQREEYADKIWIFDRAIISAYTWAMLRDRLSPEEAKTEFIKLMSSVLFRNCKTLLVTATSQTADSDRVKDLWDGAHSTKEELGLMTELIELCNMQLTDTFKNNQFATVENQFEQSSVDEFNQLCYQLLGFEPNK